MLLSPANDAEKGHMPVKAGQLQQALRHSHSSTQRQINQTLDRQAELHSFIAVLLAARTLAGGFAVLADDDIRSGVT